MATSIVFPGQATQYPKMGYEIIKEDKDLKKYYKIASDILGRDLYSELFESTDVFMKNKIDIQPAVFLTSYVSYRYMEKRLNTRPVYLAGHSLGEITALVCAGMISFEDGIRMVEKRSEYMVGAAEQRKGVMTSIFNVEPERVEEYVKNNNTIYISCYNSYSQTVIGGSEEEIDKAEAYFLGIGGKAKRLRTIGVFHTPFMKEASEEFGRFLEQLQFKAPEIPVISNVTARPYATCEDVKHLLAKQLVSPVQWEKTIQFLEQSFVTDLIEVLPGMTLTRLCRHRNNKFKIWSMEEKTYGNMPEKADETDTIRRLSNICQCYAIGCKNQNPNMRKETVCNSYAQLSEYSYKSKTIYQKDEIMDNLNLLKEILIQKGYQEQHIQNIQEKVLYEIGIEDRNTYLED